MAHKATAAVKYGLLVRTATLASAAKAWPALKPTLRFFHLLSTRLRAGTLRSSSSTLTGHPPAVERVPLEV
ncbi:hypothetical protein JCM10207_000525 [Rhodosporidiobolus poonsookiae]